MELVQEYKQILNKLYTTKLSRKADEELRYQLADLWFDLNDAEQREVQQHSFKVRMDARKNR